MGVPHGWKRLRPWRLIKDIVMADLNFDEIEQVNGGIQWLTYIGIADMVIDFYKGFSDGFNGK